MKKVFKKIIFAFLVFLLVFVGYFFTGKAEPAEKITWGVNFSQMQAELLGLDWKETYTAILDDLEVNNLKIITHWDLLEPEEGRYDFQDLDWQIDRAQEKEASLILVLGMKTGRWPECHIPEWAEGLEDEERQKKVLNLIEKTVARYKDRESIDYWQVENEVFFSFGECPKIGMGTLKDEINLVKSLDDRDRPVIVSDSGEYSFWIRAAIYGDVVSATLHRKVWFKEIGKYVSYPLPPVFYGRKAGLVEKFFGKKVIGTELQAEPWCPTYILCNHSLKEQEKTMDLSQFKENVEFARQTGLDTFYFWGAEWWYWMKEKQADSRIWDEAGKLF